MPFKLHDPQPVQVYETPRGRSRRYWPHKQSMEHLAVSPDEVRSWKTIKFSSTANDVGPIDQKCKLQCDVTPVNTYHPEYYLRQQLLQTQPGLLPALQNTRSFRKMSGQGLDLVRPHVTHQRKRSRYLITMPRKYREALCKINENIHKNQEDKFYSLKPEGRDLASTEVRSVPRIPKSSPSVSILDDTAARSEVKLKNHANRSDLFNPKRSKANQPKDNLPPSNKDEVPLPGRIKNFFPSQVDFGRNSVNPNLHMKRYTTRHPLKGMEAMCANHSGHAQFKESPTQELVAAKMSSENTFHAKKKLELRELLRSNIPHELNKFDLNEPRKTNAFPQDTLDFSHYGLLEQAKASALDDCLKKLYKREKMSKIPPALLYNYYGHGHIKGLPKTFGFAKHKLPCNLEEDTPPLPYEIERVENAMRKGNKVRRDKKAQGVESEELVSQFIEQFSKPTIELSVNQPPFLNKKSFVGLSEYSTKNNHFNRRDSSDFLFHQCKMGLEGEKAQTKPKMGKTVQGLRNRDSSQQRSTEFRAKSLESFDTHNSELDEEIEMNTIFSLGQRVPTLDAFSSLDGSSCSDYHGSAIRPPVLKYYDNAKDSREFLPFPDTMYSKINIPNQVVQMIDDNKLYQALLKDQNSPSSSENEHNFSGESEEDEEEDDYGLDVEESQTSIELSKIFNGIQAYMKGEDT